VTDVLQFRLFPRGVKTHGGCSVVETLESCLPPSWILCKKYRIISGIHRRRNERKSGTAQIHGERGSASLYRGLGAEPPAGSRGRAPGQGGKAP